ncbi:hypothetical protein PRK78_005270 [Emydomyces testavorans]|uniref:ABC transporter domain-containing protein n=1 Tax=Emydomyces testavorans TaxID=2070801 RepID=A0AAF0DJC3_9EURO|nr:hypothetical protein PRK78_005270 [Emydomyces testavorans]
MATCKQTRFHLRDDKRSGGEIDIQGLDILVSSSSSPSGSGESSTPGRSTTLDSSTSPKSRKQKARRSPGKEILSNANLRLKPGVHYGLVGRNGTGKSSA